jgi:hypothetical protein
MDARLAVRPLPFIDWAADRRTDLQGCVALWIVKLSTLALGQTSDPIHKQKADHHEAEEEREPTQSVTGSITLRSDRMCEVRATKPGEKAEVQMATVHGFTSLAVSQLLHC